MKEGKNRERKKRGGSGQRLGGTFKWRQWKRKMTSEGDSRIC